MDFVAGGGNDIDVTLVRIGQGLPIDVAERNLSCNCMGLLHLCIGLSLDHSFN